MMMMKTMMMMMMMMMMMTHLREGRLFTVPYFPVSS